MPVGCGNWSAVRATGGGRKLIGGERRQRRGDAVFAFSPCWPASSALMFFDVNEG